MHRFHKPILTLSILSLLVGVAYSQFAVRKRTHFPTPTFSESNPHNVNVAENTTAVTTVTATASVGRINYSLTGTDAAFFSISSAGVITFDAAPNYENAQDFNGDNVYTFNAVASIGGALSPAGSIVVNATVTDEEEGAPEAPTIVNADPLNVSMGENSNSVASINATGDAPITFSISGTDASLFTINSSTGALSFIDAPDYETPGDDGGNNVYNLTVTAANGVSPDDSIDVVVTVTDVDEAEYAFFNTLLGRTDYQDSMTWRSQTDIDDHTIGNVANASTLWPYLYDNTNPEIRYDPTEDAGHVVVAASINTATSAVALGTQLQTGPDSVTGCHVFVFDIKWDPTIYDYAENLINWKFSMISEEGGGVRHRFELRFFFIAGGTSNSAYLIDVRPYLLGAEEDGIGAGLGRITPYTDPTLVPTDEWLRVVQKVDFNQDPAEYSLYVIDATDTITTVYEDIPCPLLVTNGGIDRWTPAWINTSNSGETVSNITSSGTTVTVTWPDHGLEVGDPIRMHPAPAGGVPYQLYGAEQDEYNGEWEVASVIDPDTITYICDSTPSASPATPAGSEFRMMALRSNCWERNFVHLWDELTIDLTPILVGDDL